MNLMNRALGACLLVSLAGGTAVAQEAMPAPTQEADQAQDGRDPRAVEILEQSRAAIAEAKTLVFGVEKSMEKTDELAPENAIFATIQLGARGEVRAARDNEGRWVYRLEGTADDIGNPGAFQISIVQRPATVSWLDYESNTLVTANRSLARSREISSAPEFGVKYVFGESYRPQFEQELAAPTLEVLEAEVVDDVLCDVVRVRYGKPNDSGDKLLYLGTVDGLPRRVHEVLVRGFENRWVFTFQDAERTPTIDNLDLEAPSGWMLAYRPESLDPGYERPQRPAPEAAQPGEGVIGYEAGNRAPAFSGMTLLGDLVDSETIAGKPAVLAFWASWLPSATEMVRFFETTREAHGEGVELITFAVRERNADAAFNMLSQAGLDDVPMLVDARDAVLAYGVTRAPIIIVVDAEGVIRYRSQGVDADVETMVAEALEAIESVAGE